jgi:phosphoribosylformylglycinamidine synthase
MDKTRTAAVAETQMVNEMRLTARQCALALSIILLVVFLTPRLWKGIERFDTGPDYRIPYDLSKDYWLYQRRLEDKIDPRSIVMLGDSVVWGEYVLPDGTWSHFLNEQTGQTNKFVNGGVNGLFPLALEGLVDYYGQALRNRKVILHCNLLWLSSPKADLQIDKEETFNHSRLVPQFFPRIPCYKADANQRLSAVVERNVDFSEWVNHLQCAYFGQKSIPSWTLEDDGGDPARYPNSYKDPLAQITFNVPSTPRDDPQRGPESPRHKPWSESGGATQFEWVDLNTSLQWGAFRRIVRTLRERGDDVFVILGPFNEYMVAQESRAPYRKLRDGVTAWLTENKVPHWVPEVLPSLLYADASHPLTDGYALLARRTLTSDDFQSWLKLPMHAASASASVSSYFQSWALSPQKKLACAADCLNIGPCRWQGAINMKAKIIVTPKKAVLDPQGKTVQGALEHMGYKGIGAVHVGKYLEIELPDSDKVVWHKQIDEACHKLLSNPVIEDYRFEIE